MNKAFTLKYLNLAFFIGMILINMLANMLPIGNGNTGEISGKYPNLFTPAAITFSIWGVIYIMTTVFIVYQMGFMDGHDFSEKLVKLIGGWFIISCIMNMGWIFSWHYEKIELSMVFMIGLLISLIVIGDRLSPDYIYQETDLLTIPKLASFTTYTFQIYLGWITAATIANMSVLLVKLNWSGLGLSPTIWTIVVIIIAAIIGMLFVIVSGSYFAALAIAWAFCGILVKHISAEGYSGAYPLIIISGISGIFLILCTIVVRLLMNVNKI